MHFNPLRAQAALTYQNLSFSATSGCARRSKPCALNKLAADYTDLRNWFAQLSQSRSRHESSRPAAGGYQAAFLIFTLLARGLTCHETPQHREMLNSLFCRSSFLCTHADAVPHNSVRARDRRARICIFRKVNRCSSLIHPDARWRETRPQQRVEFLSAGRIFQRYRRNPCSICIMFAPRDGSATRFAVPFSVLCDPNVIAKHRRALYAEWAIVTTLHIRKHGLRRDRDWAARSLRARRLYLHQGISLRPENTR